MYFQFQSLTHTFLNNNRCVETWLGIKAASNTKDGMNNPTKQGYEEKIFKEFNCHDGRHKEDPYQLPCAGKEKLFPSPHFQELILKLKFFF